MLDFIKMMIIKKYLENILKLYIFFTNILRNFKNSDFPKNFI